MYRACIAIVDATRARVFTYEHTSDPSGVHEQLVEVIDLVDPARRRTPHELFSDSRPGTSRVGGRQYGFDDHRDAHIEHFDREFARSIIDEIDRVVQASGARRLVICASAKMLGALREASGPLHRAGLVLDELPRDLVKLSTPQIRDQLAAYGLLPPRPPRPALAHEA